MGVATALGGIALGAVRPEKGGGLAVVAFLVCMAGMWLQYGVAARTGRKAMLVHRQSQLDALRGGYQVVLDASGMGFTMPQSRTWIGWSRVEAASLEGELVLVRSRLGSVVVLPVRCFPDDWTGERLATAVNGAVAAARPGNGAGQAV